MQKLINLDRDFFKTKGCVYNQDVAKMIKDTKGMVIENETQYAAGLFRAYKCSVEWSVYIYTFERGRRI